MTTLEAQDLAGDCNRDGAIDIGDVIRSFDYQFSAGRDLDCAALCDTNGDGRVDLSDPIGLLNYLFVGIAPRVTPELEVQERCNGFDDTCDGEIDENCPDSDGVTVTLAWNPVLTDVERRPIEVASYVVYVGTQPGEYAWTYMVRAPGTRVAIPGLVPGQTHYASIVAIRRSRVGSAFATEIEFQAPLR